MSGEVIVNAFIGWAVINFALMGVWFFVVWRAGRGQRRARIDTAPTVVNWDGKRIATLSNERARRRAGRDQATAKQLSGWR